MYRLYRVSFYQMFESCWNLIHPIILALIYRLAKPILWTLFSALHQRSTFELRRVRGLLCFSSSSWYIDLVVNQILTFHILCSPHSIYSSELWFINLVCVNHFCEFACAIFPYFSSNNFCLQTCIWILYNACSICCFYVVNCAKYYAVRGNCIIQYSSFNSWIFD